MLSYFSKKVKECDERILDYELKLREVPHFRGLIAIEESKKKALKKEMDSELRRLEKEYQTTVSSSR